MTRRALLIACAAAALSCVLLTASVLSARTEDVPEPEPIEAAMLVNTTRHLKVAMYTGRQMLSGKDYPAKTFHVVLIGDAVKDLRKGGDLADEIEAARKAGVRIAACKIAMRARGVEDAQLVKGVDVVPNGFTELFRLQARGVLSIEI